jgi:hypothetical protein
MRLAEFVSKGPDTHVWVGFLVIEMMDPVAKVDPKMRANGTHVPRRLPNIARLRLINKPTTRKSTAITKRTNTAAVAEALVKLKRLK